LNVTLASELYDHTSDPGNGFDWVGVEMNLAANEPQYADDVVKEHAQMLRDGWQSLRRRRQPCPNRRQSALYDSIIGFKFVFLTPN